MRFNNPLVRQLDDKLKAEQLGCAFDVELECIEECIAELKAERDEALRKLRARTNKLPACG